MAQGPCTGEQAQGSTEQGPRPIAQGPGLVVVRYEEKKSGLTIHLIRKRPRGATREDQVSKAAKCYRTIEVIY